MSTSHHDRARRRRCADAVLAAMLALARAAPAGAAAAPDGPGTAAAPARPAPAPEEEPYATGWSFYLDNDFLSLVTSSDQQYTGGFAYTLSGRRAAEYPWSLDPALGWIDRVTGWSSLYRDTPRHVAHSWEIGMTAFTPEDIDVREPVLDDHPYAGLVFVNNTREAMRRDARVSYLSGFSVGLLGTEIPERVQDAFHELAGDDKARGWENQISEGGEPTLLWTVQRQQTHFQRYSPERSDFEIKSIVGGSVGYVTQLNAGFNWRWGDLATPWWSFNPDYGEYINLGTPAARRGDGRELYLWGGLQLRYRVYNAFLEGQFRDSAVTFDREDDLDSTLLEGSLGVTWGFPNGYSTSFALRARERELPGAEGQRPVWGSLIIARSF